MILNKPSYWNEIEEFSGDSNEPISAGGHYLQILGIKQKSGTNNNGPWDALEVYFDFHSTDHQAGLITAKYKNNQQYRKDANWPGAGRKLVSLPVDGDVNSGRSLKTFITCLEHSNDGFVFDFKKDVESQIKNKIIGGVFRDKEYDFDGKTGMTSECYYFVSSDKIPEVKVPNPKLLDGSNKLSLEDTTNLPFDL